MNEFAERDKKNIIVEKREIKNTEIEDNFDEEISNLFFVPEDRTILMENAFKLLTLLTEHRLSPEYYENTACFIPLLVPTVLDNEKDTSFFVLIYTHLIDNEMICNFLIENKIHEALWQFTPYPSTFLLWEKLLKFNTGPIRRDSNEVYLPPLSPYNTIFNFLSENSFVEILFEKLKETPLSSDIFEAIGSPLKAFGCYYRNDEGFLLCRPIIEFLMQVFVEDGDFENRRKIFSLIVFFPFWSHQARVFILSNTVFVDTVLTPVEDPVVCEQICSFVGALIRNERDVDPSVLERIVANSKMLIDTEEELYVSAATYLISESCLFKGIVDICESNGIIDALFNLFGATFSYSTKVGIMRSICNLALMATSENIDFFLERGFIDFVFENINEFYYTAGYEMIDSLWGIATIAEETGNEELTAAIFENDGMDIIHEKYDELRASCDISTLDEDSLGICIIALITKDPGFDIIHD